MFMGGTSRFLVLFSLRSVLKLGLVVTVSGQPWLSHVDSNESCWTSLGMSPGSVWVNQLLMANTLLTGPPADSAWPQPCAAAERSHDRSSPDMSHCAYKRRPLSSAALWRHFICSVLQRMDCWASQSAHSGKDSRYISYGKENTVRTMREAIDNAIKKRSFIFMLYLGGHETEIHIVSVVFLLPEGKLS